jgi:hypothetical protein
VPAVEPTMPSDPPLIQVIQELEDEGFAAQFVPREGGVVRCPTGGHVFSASSSEPSDCRRLEGVSDPADMVMVVALRCPVCDVAGTLVLHYGPEASPEESDVLAALDPPTHQVSGT